MPSTSSSRSRTSAVSILAAVSTLAAGIAACSAGTSTSTSQQAGGDEATVKSAEQALAPGGGSYSMRFEYGIPNCSLTLLQSGGGCPSSDSKCLCIPEFNALNSPKGSTGNPNGKLIYLIQPQYGDQGNGTYAFDAYTAIKNAGNFVAHFVNAMNPDASCTAAQSWTGTACSGGSGCGFNCVTGTAQADAIIAAENAAYTGSYAPPKWIAMNEAWSLIYDNTTAGINYRTWIRDLAREMSTQNKWPLIYVQQISSSTGPYTLLGETASYAWFGVEAYVSGQMIRAASGQCAPPYDSSNYCYNQYNAVRNAVRNSGSPAIPYDRLLMTEHFATNTWVNADGSTNYWGRTYDDNPNSPYYGTPSTGTWSTDITRRANAVKALSSLGGVTSYAWDGNASGNGSSYRIGFANAWSAVTLP